MTINRKNQILRCNLEKLKREHEEHNSAIKWWHFWDSPDEGTVALLEVLIGLTYETLVTDVSIILPDYIREQIEMLDL